MGDGDWGGRVGAGKGGRGIGGRECGEEGTEDR